MVYLLITFIFSIPVSEYMWQTESIHSFSVEAIEGGKIDFSEFRGKKILVVNTASECGFTPQYAGLEELYQAYKDKLVIVGFPANNFGNQEPGSNEQIAEFCESNYGVTFPMAQKVSVKGQDQHELFAWLISQPNPDFTGEIQWNFEKFLLDEEGKLLRRYRSSVEPVSEEILQSVE